MTITGISYEDMTTGESQVVNLDGIFGTDWISS